MHDNTSIGLINSAIDVQNERAKEYDQPSGERNMAKIVDIFNRFHGLGMTEVQGWHFMEILKDVRFFSAPDFHRDSVVDKIGYTALRGERAANAPGADLIGVSAQSDDEGWIDWNGGECPVDLDTVVDCIYTDGFKAFGTRARNFLWVKTGARTDIEKYRIHKEQ